MYSLILLRHAKSSFKETTGKDGKRPLSKRGEKNAVQIGNLLKERELIPQIILSSTAVRATQTAEIISKIIGFSGEIRLDEDLYMAEADDILKLLRKLPDETERVMVIGHNPGLESLIPMLTERVESLPTAGVAYLSLPILHWKELKSKTKAELIELWRLKDLEVG
jgi:phosphohistidine phosphatase